MSENEMTDLLVEFQENIKKDENVEEPECLKEEITEFWVTSEPHRK